MRIRQSWIVLIEVFLLFAMAASVLYAAPGIDGTATEEETIIWKLRDGHIYNSGETVEVAEGFLGQGYTIRATASSKAKLVPEGTFELTLTAFNPKRDMPGQKQGIWYVRGNWSIANDSVDPDSRKARHTPEVIKGDFEAELTFNPLETVKNFSGLIRLPMSTAGERWGKGEGTLSLNKKFNGELFLELERWPAKK